MPAVLSVDFELFSHTFAFQKSGNKKSDIGLDGLDNLLKLFDEENVRTTFFTVGDLCRLPESIESIVDKGHEIGSHSMTHSNFRKLNEDEISGEISLSRKMLSKVAKSKIRGFRSPTCYYSEHLVNAVRKSGYDYDSSVMPSLPIPGFYSSSIKKFEPFYSKGIMEFPLSVHPVLKMPMGGFWLRFFGARYVCSSIKYLTKRNITPIFYVHPWECADLPRLKGIPWRLYYKTGKINLDRIRYIIKNAGVKFISMEDMLNE